MMNIDSIDAVQFKLKLPCIDSDVAEIPTLIS